MRKKLLTLMLVLSATFATAMPVSAKNNNDINFPTKKIGFSSSQAFHTGYAAKEDKSSHYIKNTSGFNLLVISQAPGGRNCTNKNRAIIPTAERFIYNQIYEWGYRSCRLKITTANSGTSGYLKGCWSPDSVGNYPVANP